jgi:hypothetical protein
MKVTKVRTSGEAYYKSLTYALTRSKLHPWIIEKLRNYRNLSLFACGSTELCWTLADFFRFLMFLHSR